MKFNKKGCPKSYLYFRQFGDTCKNLMGPQLIPLGFFFRHSHPSQERAHLWTLADVKVAGGGPPGVLEETQDCIVGEQDEGAPGGQCLAR